MVPAEVDGEIVIKIAPEKSPAYELNGTSAIDPKEITSILRDWHQAYSSCLEEKITPEDYDAWRDKYPSFTNFDKEGVPIYGKDVNPDYQPLTLEERRKKDGPLRAFIAELDKKLIEAANMDD